MHDETVRQLTGYPESPLDAETIVAHIGGSERAQANEIRQRLIDEHGHSEDQVAGRSLQELTTSRSGTTATTSTPARTPAKESPGSGWNGRQPHRGHGVETEGIGTAAGTPAETDAEATHSTSVQLGPTDPIDPVESGSVDEDAYTTVVSGSRTIRRHRTARVTRTTATGRTRARRAHLARRAHRIEWGRHRRRRIGRGGLRRRRRRSRRRRHGGHGGHGRRGRRGRRESD